MSGFAFRPPPGRRVRGDAVAMINVAFLLLVFFLLVAQIAPPDPVEVTLPEADGGSPVSGETALHVGPGGELAFGAARGDAVFATIADAARAEAPLPLRVDREFDGQALAALLARLRAAGVAEVSLAVSPAP